MATFHFKKMNCVIKIIFCSFLICLSIFNNLFSQNSSYKKYNDSIEPILYLDYARAKEIFIAMDKDQNNPIDPLYKIQFLIQALQKKDTGFFKLQIGDLIQNNAWTLTASDTFENCSQICAYIKWRGLCDWTIKQSEINHPYYLSRKEKNAKANSKLIELLGTIASDRNSNTKNKFISSDVYLDYIKILDSINQSQNIFINCFDNGTLANQFVDIIVSALCHKDIFVKLLELLRPNIEHAYLLGKINNQYFQIIDKYYVLHYGFQYYGTIDLAAPIDDKVSVRKKRFKL